MKNKLTRFALAAAAFYALYFAYQLFWASAGIVVLQRIGYELWQWASTEDTLNHRRMLFVKWVLGDAMPWLFGSLGFFWSLYFLKDKSKD
jgi:hypothetical protein